MVEIYKFSFSNSAAGGEMGMRALGKPQRPFRSLLQLLILSLTLLLFSTHICFASTILTIYRGACTNLNEKIINYTNSTAFCVVLNSTTAFPQSEFQVRINSTFDEKGILLDLSCDKNETINSTLYCYNGHVDVYVSDVSNQTKHEIAVNYSTNYSGIGVYFPDYIAYVNKTFFVWDNEPPSIDLHTDLFQNVTRDENLTIDYVAYDNSNEALNCSLLLYNYSFENNKFYLEKEELETSLPGSLSNFTFKTGYGIKKAVIICRDKAGNRGNVSFYFAVDNKRPEIEIYKPFNSTVLVPVEIFDPSLNGGKPGLNYTISDLSISFFKFLNSSLPGLYCWGYLDNHALKKLAYDKFFQNLGYMLNHSSTYLASGKNVLFVECEDAAGNKASVFKVFYVDKSKPIASVKISPYIVYGSPTFFKFNAAFSAMDDASKDLNCTFALYNGVYLYYKKWFIMENGTVINETITVNKTSPLFTTPEMTATFYCGDNITLEGQFSSFAKYHISDYYKTYFLLDTFPPKVYVLFPQSLNYIGFGNRSIVFKVRVIDDTNKVLRCFYEINNSLGEFKSKELYFDNGEIENLTINPEFVAQGWNKFALICKDGGNRTGVFPNPATYSQPYLRFLADFQPPTKPYFKSPVLYLTMFNGSIYDSQGQKITNVSWSKSADNINVSYYKIYISNYLNSNYSQPIISKVNALNVTYTASPNGLYILIFSNETGQRIQASGNLPVFIRVYAYDELNHKSDAGTLIILPIVKSIENSNLICYSNRTCALNISNANYSVAEWTWQYNQTSNVKVNETLERWPLIHILDWMSKSVYGIPPLSAVLNNNSKVDVDVLKYLDTKFYHLPDNEEMSLKFSRIIMPNDMFCVSGFTTNNSTLYVVTKLGLVPMLTNPPTTTQEFNISCINAKAYGLNYENVTLLCAQGTHSCYVNFAGIFNNFAPELKINSIEFEGKKIYPSWEITTQDFISSQNFEYGAKNLSQEFVPLLENYSWASRTQDPEKTTQANGEAYSILPIHIKNYADVGFYSVILIPPKECNFENTTCLLTKLEFVPPATTTTYDLKVGIKNAVVYKVISEGTLAERTIYVDEDVPAYFTLEIKNKDDIPYSSVVVNPKFDGWLGDEFKVSLEANGKVTKRVLLHKKLIYVVRKESAHENLPGCKVLNKFNYILEVSDNITSYKPQAVLFKKPLSDYPGINERGLRILLDGKNVTFNTTNGYLIVTLPTTLSKGTHDVTISYITLSHSCGRPIPLKKEAKKPIVEKPVLKRVPIKNKKPVPTTKKKEKKKSENTVNAIEIQMTTKELKKIITFKVPKTLLNLSITAKNVPPGLKVKILNDNIPFAKKNTTIKVEIEIKDNGLSTGIHSFLITLAGKTIDGKQVTLSKKIIVDKTVPVSTQNVEKAAVKKRPALKIVPKITGFFSKFMANPEYVLIIFVVLSILILLKKRKRRYGKYKRKYLNLRGKI